MLKFSLKEIFKITLAVFIGTTILYAQTPKKTKGVGTKSKAASEQASAPETTAAVVDTKPKSKKKVVVVLNFDDASLTAENQKRAMGRQIAVLISNEFARRGDFDVIERDSIDKVIKEQDGSYDSRNDPKLAAQIGRNWSASSVVVGTITEYTITTKRTVILGVGKITTTAKVGLAVRLVNVNTGEIQDSVSVNGSENKSDNINPYSVTSTDMTEDLRTSLLTSAANKAIVDSVNKLEKLIDKSSRPADPNQPAVTAPAPQQEEKKQGGMFGKINPFGKKSKKEESSPSAPQNSKLADPAPSAAVTATPGKVIAVMTGKIVLKGTFSGAKVGTKLNVYRVVKEHLDPDNPKIVAFTETEEVGIIEILEIQPGGISAKIVSGTGIKTGDLVKLP